MEMPTQLVHRREAVSRRAGEPWVDTEKEEALSL